MPDESCRRAGSRPGSVTSIVSAASLPVIEDSVLDSSADQAAEAQRRLVADGIIDGAVPCVIGTGSGWVESVGSIDWQRDELLAIGSSAAGPLARVFLGSRAAKLIRAASVPVVMLPS